MFSASKATNVNFSKRVLLFLEPRIIVGYTTGIGERLFEQRESATNSGQTSQFFLTFLDGIESTVGGDEISGMGEGTELRTDRVDPALPKGPTGRRD